jgi:membrane fusion protein, macrolide-specific efflux system
MRLKIAAIVVLLAVGGGAVAVAAGALTPAATSATTLLTATAAVTDVTDEIAATGTVQAASQYDLAFGAAAAETDGSSASASSSSSNSSPTGSVTWPVTAVKVAVGDQVTAGQVLATADPKDVDAQIADARRAASSAAIQLKQAKTDHSNATDTASRRQTQVALYNAESADAKAKSDLASLLELRKYATLTAPAAGTVTAVAIAAGADAPDGAAITMISSDLRIATSVVESDIAAIKIDQEATVSIAALDASLVGKVVSIDPVGSATGTNGVVSFAVDVKLDAPPAGLRPGMSADITIVAASATNVLAIPSRALSGTADAYTVRVMAADGSVSVRDVQVGLVTSSLAEIKSGLQAGERVVTGTSSSQNSTNTVGGGGAFPGGGVIRGVGR